MIPEAADFKSDCEALAGLFDEIDDRDLSNPTQFKSWTIEDVIAHLYVWNAAALLTLNEPSRFEAFRSRIIGLTDQGWSHRDAQRLWLDEQEDGLSGRALVDQWRANYPLVAKAYGEADPEARVAWAGPEMTTTSKIIARQMETWAHGQAVFDLLGKRRVDADRIRNIAHLGVITFSWSFRNRGEEPPAPKPHVKLTAPSGAIWEWNEKQSNNAVVGSATGFCQVVTQTRNVADTDLTVTGNIAAAWMSRAQCFAGPPESPPAPGTRGITAGGA